MGPAFSLAYGAAGQLARALAALTPAGAGAKLARALRARHGIRPRYAAWGNNGRDLTRPLLWMHAPSVGEGLQARPVIAGMRERHARLQVAYTFFSPSAERFALGIGADFTDYLPFDTAGDARAALDALRPTVLAFSKLDVWPVLVGAAAARRIPLALVSATLADGSHRRSAFAAPFLRAAYSALDVVGAVHASDAERLIALGVRDDVIEVTGDTRYDQVWERAENARRSDLVARLRADRPTLVAGSTWPADERHLLPAIEQVRATIPEFRVIIAPHETTPAHVDAIVAWARGARLAHASVDAPDAATADVILVDRMGVLGDLYALADVAYVGGGFHAAGLHSVVEPAAFGAPVLFGPRHRNSRDATLLATERGGAIVGDAAAIERQLKAWLTNAGERRAAGDHARALVASGRGATARTVTLLERLLSKSPASARR